MNPGHGLPVDANELGAAPQRAILRGVVTDEISTIYLPDVERNIACVLVDEPLPMIEVGMPVLEAVEVGRKVLEKRQIVHRPVNPIVERIEHLFHAGHGRVVPQTGVIGAQLPPQVQQIVVGLVRRK